MGRAHARNILEGKAPRVRLAAVADADPARLAAFPDLPGFAAIEPMIESGLIDSVLIATPHYRHTTEGIAALTAGLHVLIEKPISVQKADCEKLIAAHRGRRQVFAAMFNQRTDPHYIKLRNLIRQGSLGAVRRVNWIVTDWFRPNAYYASGGWRATWAGEGGGVLLNQCPHNLDLFQWLFGMPVRVHGFCQFGRYHSIEVEDDVTAYFELKDGAHATFITSTGEAPGTNRLEVVAEKGRVVVEGDRIAFTRNAVPTSVFSATTREPFAAPATKDVAIVADGHGGQHVEIIRNFAAAILDGRALIAPAAEGARSVELANAILLSTWTGRAVDIPISGAVYARWLRRKIAGALRGSGAPRGGLPPEDSKRKGRKRGARPNTAHSRT